jgi:hypothetical protein
MMMAKMSALDRCKHFGVSNIRGMAYMPGPSNYTKEKKAQYFDSDFYNGDFQALWSAKGDGMGPDARSDLHRFSEKLGANFIHCYDWSAPVPEIGLRNHLIFLARCAELGMKATVPISNYTYLCMADTPNKKPWETPATAHLNIQKVFKEIYSQGQGPAPGAGMWKIFNEYELWYDRNPAHVVTAMTWLVEEEDRLDLPDSARLPIMVDCSFGMKDGIEGAGYVKDVWDRLIGQSRIGSYSPRDFWNARFVFSTNPQNDGPDIASFLSTRLPQYWASRGIPVPPVMFTELGSSIEQTGSEQKQAEWMARQLAASVPGGSNGMMLGACVFINEQRPWEDGPERTFGVLKFGASTEWPWPSSSPYVMPTHYPAWNEKGDPYAVSGSYPVEQQVAKLNYLAVMKAWKG